MLFTTRLLVLPLAIGLPEHAIPDTRANLAPAPAQTAADTVPISVRWNRLVPKLLEEVTARRRAARAAAAGDSAALRRIAQTPPPPMLFRIHTVLSVAQYAAVSAARDNRDISAGVVVASASAAVLTEMFTDSAARASIARELDRDLNIARAAARTTDQTIAARRAGEDIARRLLKSAPTINLVAPWNGTIPKGPGMWYSARGVPPIGVTIAQSRGWLLDSVSQFRPAPPPVFGTPEFQAALDEVRRVARERTREQTQVARRWNDSDPWAVWNEKASDAIQRHRLPEADAARVLALVNVAASDAIIACFDAKYHYWTIRPSQADTTLVLADSVGLPNFPAYPSGHACSAGAFDAVLGHFFPKERAEFTRVAEEQAMSRLYGGVHYRFDNDIGLELGRAVARHVIDRERIVGFRKFLEPVASPKP